MLQPHYISHHIHLGSYFLEFLDCLRCCFYHSVLVHEPEVVHILNREEGVQRRVNKLWLGGFTIAERRVYKFWWLDALNHCQKGKE